MKDQPSQHQRIIPTILILNYDFTDSSHLTVFLVKLILPPIHYKQ